MRKKLIFCFAFFFLSFLKVEIPRAETTSSREVVFGIASWYSESDSGIQPRTANGETFEDSRLTCASWDFPFGAFVLVTNLSNDKRIVCRVNDRGPAKRLGRLIDLTKATFQAIAPLELGLIPVKVEKWEKAKNY